MCVSACGENCQRRRKQCDHAYISCGLLPSGQSLPTIPTPSHYLSTNPSATQGDRNAGNGGACEALSAHCCEYTSHHHPHPKCFSSTIPHYLQWRNLSPPTIMCSGQDRPAPVVPVPCDRLVHHYRPSAAVCLPPQTTPAWCLYHLYPTLPYCWEEASRTCVPCHTCVEGGRGQDMTTCHASLEALPRVYTGQNIMPATLHCRSSCIAPYHLGVKLRLGLL